MSAGPGMESTATREANAAMKASLHAAAVPVHASSAAALGASAALLALIILSVAWEWWLAPLRPGGSALVLKAVPLLLALPGVWRRRLYTLQWASMLILLYFAEGVVRGWSDHGLSARLGWLQTALAVVFFVCTLAYVGPFKRAAKRAAKGAAKRAASQMTASNTASAAVDPAIEPDAQHGSTPAPLQAAAFAADSTANQPTSAPATDVDRHSSPNAGKAR